METELESQYQGAVKGLTLHVKESAQKIKPHLLEIDVYEEGRRIVAMRPLIRSKEFTIVSKALSEEELVKTQITIAVQRHEERLKASQ